MSKCSVCKTDLGWLGHYRCSNHREIFYGDRVIIVDGFYKGQKGKIISTSNTDAGCYYSVLLKDGTLAEYIKWGDLENIKWRKK